MTVIRHMWILVGAAVLAAGCLGGPIAPANASPDVDVQTAVATPGEGTIHDEVIGACRDTPEGYTCTGASGGSSASFALSAPASLVRIVFAWTPSSSMSEEMVVYALANDSYVSVQGPSPQTLELPDVPAGKHKVGTHFADVVAGPLYQEVAWRIEITD